MSPAIVKHCGSISLIIGVDNTSPSKRPGFVVVRFVRGRSPFGQGCGGQKFEIHMEAVDTLACQPFEEYIQIGYRSLKAPTAKTRLLPLPIE